MEYEYLGKRFGNYGMLGNSCQSSMAVLLDNRKFLSPDDPIYNLIYTRFYQAPFGNQNRIRTVDQEKLEERPEALKVEKNSSNTQDDNVEEFRPCCRNKK